MNVDVERISSLTDDGSSMDDGGKPVEGGNLFLSPGEKRDLLNRQTQAAGFIKTVYGASEYIRGDVRHCLWIGDNASQQARLIPEIEARLKRVAEVRAKSPKAATKKG